MTAWSILTANSTSPNGSTAWAHLNAQQGGGTGTSVNAIAQIVGAARNGALSVTNANGSLTFKPTSPTLSLSVRDDSLELGVNNGSIDYNGG